MKKVLTLFGLLFVLLGSAHAQKGKQAIGFGLSYGTEIESIGLGIKYQYNITNPIRIEPSFNYFFENDNVSMLDLNVNFHYLFPVAKSYQYRSCIQILREQRIFSGTDYTEFTEIQITRKTRIFFILLP